MMLLLLLLSSKLSITEDALYALKSNDILPQLINLMETHLVLDENAAVLALRILVTLASEEDYQDTVQKCHLVHSAVHALETTKDTFNRVTVWILNLLLALSQFDDNRAEMTEHDCIKHVLNLLYLTINPTDTVLETTPVSDSLAVELKASPDDPQSEPASFTDPGLVDFIPVPAFIHRLSEKCFEVLSSLSYDDENVDVMMDNNISEFIASFFATVVAKHNSFMSAGGHPTIEISKTLSAALPAPASQSSISRDIWKPSPSSSHAIRNCVQLLNDILSVPEHRTSLANDDPTLLAAIAALINVGSAKLDCYLQNIPYDNDASATPSSEKSSPDLPMILNFAFSQVMVVLYD